jgi:hypothetical protein
MRNVPFDSYSRLNRNPPNKSLPSSCCAFYPCNRHNSASRRRAGLHHTASLLPSLSSVHKIRSRIPNSPRAARSTPLHIFLSAICRPASQKPNLLPVEWTRLVPAFVPKNVSAENAKPSVLLAFCTAKLVGTRCPQAISKDSSDSSDRRHNENGSRRNHFFLR